MAEIGPKNDETHHTWITVGWNLINFSRDDTNPTAYLTSSKLLFGSVLSNPNEKFMCADISNLYLNNPMYWYEYMKLSLYIIPEKNPTI